MKPIRLSIFVILLLQINHSLFAQCFTINTFPYQESFELTSANWYSGGTNNDWIWGAPAKPTINAAGAGINCWITGGLTASFYNLGERSWVNSPCFDFTNLSTPYVSFLIFWETERKYDGANFQYSTDGGQNWINAGSHSDPDGCNDHNWFNIASITNLNGYVTNSEGWSGTTQSSSGSCNGGNGSGGWKLASHCLEFLGGEPMVNFRFTFGSGTTCNNFDGFAFDDVYVGEAPSITDDFTYSCTGGNKILFSDLNPACHSNWTWNFGDPASANNTMNGNDVVHDFSSGGFFNVTFKAGGACSNDTQIVKQIKVLSLTTSSTDVSCIGDNDGSARVVVSNAGPNISYSWSHDTLLNSSVASGLTIGTYQVKIIDSSSCTISVDIDVQYGSGATPSVSIGEDTVICPGTQFLLRPGSFTSYKWQDNSNDSIFIVQTEGDYSVSITNSSGCIASDSIIVKEDCLQDILFPNAFTPNGDGLNESFRVEGSETSTFKIMIFNRWGEMIYTSEDMFNGWDGVYKGRPVEEGFYNFIVNYSISGEDRMKNGSVYLYR